MGIFTPVAGTFTISLEKPMGEPGVETHTINTSTWEIEAGKSMSLGSAWSAQ